MVVFYFTSAATIMQFFRCTSKGMKRAKGKDKVGM
jgi:hypothetical protein